MVRSVPLFISACILGLSLLVAGGLFSLSGLVHSSSGKPYSSAKVTPKQHAKIQKTIFQLPKPIQVLSPSVDKDNDLIGKTCRFQADVRSWECRDCGLHSQHSTWTDCPIMQRNHMCGDLINNSDLDRPQPRKYTYLDPLETRTRNRITHYANPEKHFEQIACDAYPEDCWDFDKCPVNKPMKVYVHHNGVYPKKNRAARFTKLAEERYPGMIQVVTVPSEACMLIVACDAYQSIDDLKSHQAWNEGRNHFIWEANRCFQTRADRPFDYVTGVHYERASLATSSLMDANFRKGYDVALARTKSFHISNESHTKIFETIGQERRWLLAFKGNIYNDWTEVWWTHRWMAAEYWDKKHDPEVAIDVTCDIKQNYTDEYDYVSLLLNSTFAFAPGGGATQSFRLTEALGLGAIPVVTPDLLAPFEHDLDWSGCLIRVSEARIVDLPRLLRQIPREEINRRQRRCQELFQKTVGWIPWRKTDDWRIDVDRTLFMTSLKIWAHRIQKYHADKQSQNDLENSLFVVTSQ